MAIVLRERPQLVLSTGADVAVPICLLARLLGARLVFIETAGELAPDAGRAADLPVRPPVHRPVAREAGGLPACGAGLRAAIVILVAVGTFIHGFDQLVSAADQAAGATRPRRLRPDRALARDAAPSGLGPVPAAAGAGGTYRRGQAGDLPWRDRPVGRGDAAPASRSSPCHAVGARRVAARQATRRPCSAGSPNATRSASARTRTSSPRRYERWWIGAWSIAPMISAPIFQNSSLIFSSNIEYVKLLKMTI